MSVGVTTDQKQANKELGYQLDIIYALIIKDYFFLKALNANS
jgi:hypothetical protein